jgi:hypothetical protein
MDSSDVIFHVIHSAEDTITALPFAHNFRVVLRFMSCAIFLARKSPFRRLWATIVTTKQIFIVAVKVFAEVTGSGEDHM